jgi:GT2 family glycosyltransferase
MRNGAMLTAVIPATDHPPTLGRCLAAIRAAEDPPEEVLVVDSPPGAGPAACRNAGALRAGNPIVVFVDADVLVHPDAFTRIRGAFAADPLLAALFGAYDDRPAAPGTVSAFRNLLHHHIHQAAAGPATTFCSALGAIRRDVLLATGGFDERRYARASIEDIELGLRLSERGARIVLDPRIAGTHLKVWTLRSMLATDLLHRGIPWISLLARRGTDSRALNLGWRHRLSAGCSALTIVGLVSRRRAAALAGIGGVLSLNHSFYRLLLMRRGIRGAVLSVVLHVLHHLAALVAVPVGIAVFLAERAGNRTARPEVPIGHRPSPNGAPASAAGSRRTPEPAEMP